MKIAMYQMNPKVGDLEYNLILLIDNILSAKAQGAKLFIAPELAICGYSPEDLLLRSDFINNCQYQLQKLLTISGIMMLIGAPYSENHCIYNSLYLINEGQIVNRYDKMILANYGVFDESRYFTAGTKTVVFELEGNKLGLVICEDFWHEAPIAAVRSLGAETLIVVNASPYEQNKQQQRLEIAKTIIKKYDLNIIYVNMVGGQDELVFDGASWAMNKDETIVTQMPAFTDTIDYVTLDDNNFFKNKSISVYPDSLTATYQALVLGLKDYVHKNGFTQLTLGLSGGIDSALCLVLAVDAIGADQVFALMMPSIYTHAISLEDAHKIAHNLKVKYEEISIKPIYEKFNNALFPLFLDLVEDSTEENIQARIRGMILMAIANKLGYLVLSTGNKSEIATGYATLYGDMAGGFAVLKDVSKTLVYQLANWRNQKTKVIPERIITRAPTAELKFDQLDQDSLPPYEILDQIISALVEENLSVDDVIAQGFASSIVEKVAYLLRISQHKRQQAAIGPKITKQGLAKDWRLPNTNAYKF